MHVILLAWLGAAAVAVAQHVHYQIPQVESLVESMTKAFDAWPKYHPTRSYSRHPPTASPTAGGCASYWLENIKHQGISAFNSNSSYKVFRNVKDYGAKGDGVTDDTAAINLAISSGGRCAPGGCQSSTTTPAVVYFPSGTYLISSSIIDYYYTQIIGNPNCLPTLLATANFSGFGLIDGSPYQSTGQTGFGSTNTFYRQVRNLIFDMTGIPGSSAATGIHWPTAQATSLQNVVFRMSSDNGTQHQGIFIESGSGGFMNDLVFYGGLYGLNVGNQQFTMRNLSFFNSVTAINQIWDWGWTYKGVTVNNCSVALNMSAGGPSAQGVGSVTLLDSSISNTPIGIITAHDATSSPATGGSLIVENVQLTNVPIAITGPDGTVLSGTTGSTTITAWGEGHEYVPTGPTNFEGPIAPNSRPGSLLGSGGRYYERSKPQYGTLPLQQFLSARDAGAKGDGVTDDTAALNRAIQKAAAAGKVFFFDAGTYRVTNTIYVPQNSKIVGESYSVIMSSGSYFNDIKNPKPVIKAGLPGEIGAIEWSDMIVSTQGQQAGAVLIQWNLASYGTPSGMWDVHARIGGFTGSKLQVAQCPTTPTIATPPAPVNSTCIAAYMTMHVTKFGTGIYLENVWLWTADHDLDDPTSTQITVYTGRGLYVESARGVLWLVATAVEHHSKYQYQFADTRDVFMGQVQTETAYYQPNPNATIPFPTVAAINDPVFPTSGNSNSADGWGLRILRSQNILGYGVGLYSFFSNYSTTCSGVASGEVCQNRIFSLEGGKQSRGISMYNLNTIGATAMITRDGVDLAGINSFLSTIALFRSN